MRKITSNEQNISVLYVKPVSIIVLLFSTKFGPICRAILLLHLLFVCFALFNVLHFARSLELMWLNGAMVE